MEEFNQKQPGSNGVILDAGAKLTVEPVHDMQSVKAEQSSSEIANAHANGPAIGNFEGDIETTSADPQQAQAAPTADQRAAALMEQHRAASTPKKSIKPILSVAAVAISLGLLLFFLLYR